MTNRQTTKQDLAAAAIAEAVAAERQRAMTIMALPGAAVAPALALQCVVTGLPLESADRLLATVLEGAESCSAASSGWAKAFGTQGSRPLPGDRDDWPGDDVPEPDEPAHAQSPAREGAP